MDGSGSALCTRRSTATGCAMRGRLWALHSAESHRATRTTQRHAPDRPPHMRARLPSAFRARALTADEQMQGLKPYGLRGLLSLESEMELALFVNERDELVLDLKAFVGTIARASTHKPRRVHIGPDKAIYLTSRPGTVISERPLEMLHENLVRLLWTVAYYRGVGFSEERLWKGPDPSLYGLRLWAVDALRDDAFAGTTTPAEFRVLGTVPPRLPVH